MINKRKLLMLLLFSIVLISSVSAISAADANATDVQTADVEDVELEQSDSNQDVLSAGNSYSDLNDLINSSTSSVIEFDHDYAYNQYSDVKNNLIVERDNIVIDGKGHTITGSRNTKYPAYGFTVNSNNVVIQNIHFVDMGSLSKKQDGGAILASSLNKNLTVINCTFESCYGQWGGAISSVSTVENCSFDYCYGSYGGAASSCGIIRNSNFTHCNAQEGGAVSQCKSVNCNFIDNYAGKGGAVRMSDCINCTFDGNSASYGGAVYIYYSSSIFNCTFINNKASSSGGALYSELSLFYVINSTFENNTANSYAVSYRGELVLCSFKNNVANNGLQYESGAVKKLTFYSPVSSYYFTCPDQVEIPINCAYKLGTGDNDYFKYQGKVYLFNGINTTIELYKRYSSNVIAKYSVLSGSSWIADLDKGTYTLRAMADNVDKSKDYYITVYGESTSITAENNTDIYVGEDKCLVVNLTGSQNNPLEGFNVYIKENGTVLANLTTNATGQVSFSLKNLAVGTHNLHLEFLEDARHEASSLQIAVVVNKIPVVIRADNVSALYTDNTSLLVNLTDIDNAPLEGYVLYLKENGNVLANLTTDSNGQVSFSLNDVSAGSHTLYVEFLENDAYSYSSLPVSVVISGLSTSINADDVNEHIRDDLALLATLTDEKNRPMAGYVIYLKENGNVLANLTTNEFGQVSFPLIGISSGSHILYVEFPGTRAYEGSSAPVSVVIRKSATSIEAENIYAFTIDDKKMNVRLSDDTNNPLSGATIYLKENGEVLANVTTDDFGAAVFSLNGLSAGSHDLSVEFLENDYYDYSAAEASAVINKPNTILQADDIVAFPNEGKVIAKLTDEFGNPVTDAQVYLNLAYLRNKPLDHSGNGNYMFDLEGLSAANVYTGQVIFNENDVYKGSIADISVEILNRLSSSLSADDITVFYAQYGILTAYLKDSNGNPIENEEVTLVVNAKSMSLKTDSNGTVNYDLSLFKLPAGSYNASISFDFTTRYFASSTSVHITVIKLPTILIVPDVYCTYGDGTSLVATLKDINGNPLKWQQVFFKFNSRPIDQGTDDMGRASIVINIVPGTYDIEIFFNGTNGYGSSSAIAHVVVNESNETSEGHYSGSGHNQSGENQGNNSGQNQTTVNNNTSGNGTGQNPAQTSSDAVPTTNDGVYVVITLKDDSGNLLVDTYVVIEIDGQSNSYKTNSKGQVQIQSESLVPNTYKAKVTVLDANKRPTSTFNINIVVKKAKVKIIAKKKTFKAKKKVKKYRIYLKVGKKAVKKVKVTLKIKGKTYKAKTNAKGRAIFKIKKLSKKGTYKAVIKFKGNKWYNKATKKVKIKVK